MTAEGSMCILYMRFTGDQQWQWRYFKPRDTLDQVVGGQGLSNGCAWKNAAAKLNQETFSHSKFLTRCSEMADLVILEQISH